MKVWNFKVLFYRAALTFHHTSQTKEATSQKASSKDTLHSSNPRKDQARKKEKVQAEKEGERYGERQTIAVGQPRARW